MPIPTIMPTAYSARYMPVEQEEAPTATSALLPSNVIDNHLSKEMGGVKMSKTPTLSQEEGTTLPKTPMQLNSPPRSDANGPSLGNGQSKKPFGGLTSSVVKGEAANGLLELMRAAAA